jgi:hypothetical protein
VLDNEFVYRIAYSVSREEQGKSKKLKGKRKNRTQNTGENRVKDERRRALAL